MSIRAQVIIGSLLFAGVAGYLAFNGSPAEPKCEKIGMGPSVNGHSIGMVVTSCDDGRQSIDFVINVPRPGGRTETTTMSIGADPARGVGINIQAPERR